MNEETLSLTRQQVRDADRYAIEQLGIPGAVLMENAGKNAAAVIAQHLDGADGKRVAIVAGAGNNGGDGFVIARHLEMLGASTVTFLVAPMEKPSGDAALNLSIIRNLRMDVRQVEPRQLDELGAQLRQFDLVVDAILGTGVSGPLRHDLALAVEQVNAAGRPIVAVDIPTGLDCDSGQAPGPAIKAVMTITMLARKKGFDAPQSRQHTGEVRVVDIGVPAAMVAKMAGVR